MAKKKTIPELGPVEFKLVRILWKHDPLTAPKVLDRQILPGPWLSGLLWT